MPQTYFIFLSFFTASVLADFLGPSYLAPSDLSSDQSLVAYSWQNLSQNLQNSIDGTNDSSFVTGIENVTFSLGVFSLFDDNATALQFHYTSPEILNAPNGTHKVDADSVYRIASITKVFTVLAGLIELNITDWERPLTQLLPTLDQFSEQTSGKHDPINLVDWNQITPSALAAQIAGVPRDGFPAPGELSFFSGLTFDDLVELGLPPIANNDTMEYPSCTLYLLNGTTCPSGPYLEGMEVSTPTFLPWTTPGYSDAGFTLLGLAIASIAGRSMEEIYLSDIFEPLNMGSSNSMTPPDSEWSRCVIPGDPIGSFAFEAGVAVSSGGLLSTTSDLARFGRAVLNSTLLSSEKTRRWLKPFSHTAHTQYSVGRPWEIMRYTHAGTGKVTDLYTKLGDSGYYSGLLVLIPDYQAGFSILASSTSTNLSTVVEGMADVIIDAVVPALEDQAAAEAGRNLGGVYRSADSSLNSSIKLAVNHSASAAPGLSITSWISNGTDVLRGGLGYFLGPQPYRLVPSVEDISGGKRSFWMVNARDAPGAPVESGRLVSAPGSAKADWILVDSPAYDGMAVKRFVFDVADDGRAAALSPTAFRVVLDRQDK
ncbi:unnamed protein product [Discula destructiva]